jgi:hypothetical protein
MTIQRNSDSRAGDALLSEVLAGPELGEEMEKWASSVLRKQGEILFHEGEDPGNAFFVKTGEIVLTMNVSGRGLWSVRAYDCSLLGLPAIVAMSPTR